MKEEGIAYELHEYLEKVYATLPSETTPAELQEVAIQWLVKEKEKRGHAVITHMKEIDTENEAALLLFFEDYTMLYYGFTPRGLEVKSGRYSKVEEEVRKRTIN